MSARSRSSSWWAVGFCLLALLAQPAVRAAEPSRGVVTFSTSATQEFDHDQVTVTLQVVREGAQASDVQAALQQALEAGLSQARKAALPGLLEVRTGAFSIFPRHAGTGKIAGWQGSAQLVIEGTDLARVAQTVTQLAPLSVSEVRYGLSRALRLQRQSAVAAQAIASWRQRAHDMALAFGHSGYALGDITVSDDASEAPGRPMLMARAAMVDAPPAPPLPLEPGRGQITITVSGSMVLQPSTH